MPNPSDETWQAPAGQTASSPDTPQPPPDRYRDEGSLAMGGMSEVRRVWDTVFGFHAAMKLLRHDLLDTPAAHTRFATEALITARIQHPGVVAVYAQGKTPGGRPWFTMTEVRGETFGALIARAHGQGAMAPEDLRRLVSMLLRACDAVAYAHSQGVLHRDLKPDNLMVGAFGEVLVMDWGLARALDLPDSTAASTRELLVPDARQTRMGDVLGTPAYMPPEQARGQLDQLGPTADVFALGVVLYELLTGEAPDTGGAMGVWRRRVAGAPTVFSTVPEAVPMALAEICRRAMKDDPAQRFSDAGGFGEALQEWLDGAQRRAKALDILAQAAQQRPAIDDLRAQATEHRAKAAAIMAPLLPHSPVEKKAPAWDLEDAAEEAEREAVVREVRWRQAVGTALEQVPDLPEAHAVLADHYAERLLASEQEGRRADVARFEILLGDHDRGRHARLLSGIGAVTLVTDPPGAEVRLFEYVEKRRRLVPEPRGVLGRTPLIEVPLAQGSWLLELHLPGHHVVRYPVYLERGEAWHGVRPGGHEPYPIVLPKLGEIGEDECYVPAGWFIAGGDPMAIDSLPRQKVWVDGFVMDRFPVTNGEYLAFINSPQGRESRVPEFGVDKTPLYRKEYERFTMNPARPTERLSWPIVGVKWADVRAFALWMSETKQRVVTLPHELEWEKAARGVDGRFCAWGNEIIPNYACIIGHSNQPPSRTPVTEFPLDVSPFGIRGSVGNVRDWCRNIWSKSGPAIKDQLGQTAEADLLTSDVTGSPYMSARGGAWSSVFNLSRAALRFAQEPERSNSSLGFRLSRPI